ncbi:uncharacterized protein LOC115401659 isoform X2 [Salarias fasciatus]|nr:uncharacterized protein LOC115401659 isoform X2 [Salarias fasciatus]
MYRHQSWVAFIKDVDAFVQEFLSVVQRLPSCISTLQALSRLPLPSARGQLQHFCSTNEAKFRQLRRELGLDDLLRHCESVVEKLRYPESDACYQDMAGTALFTHTAFDMLHNHSRITAAVEKVDLLWQQAFSRARLQLQLFRLRDDALQTTEEIEALLQQKLQPHKIHISKDTAEAALLASEFQASVHAPAMALVRRAEDVIRSAAEVLPPDGPGQESWALDLERLKDKLQSAVQYILQTLRAVSTHHHYYDKANQWYSSVLHQDFLQELLSGVRGDDGSAQRQRRSWGTIPAWRRKLSAFLKKNPSPDMEELLHLAHLSNAIPDEEIQQAGREMAHRCLTLRKLLISSGPVCVGSLQKALQWQYHLLCSEHHQPPAGGAVHRASSPESGPPAAQSRQEVALPPGASLAVPEGKPASPSSLDSGFDGAASGRVEAGGGRRGAADSTDWVQPASVQEKPSGAPDGEGPGAEVDLGSVGSSSRASLQVIPQSSADSLSFEIKVKRAAALPSNPWLSLPVDDLENSYTVTITPRATPQKAERGFSGGSCSSQGLPTRMEKGLQTRDWILQSHGDLDDPELGSMDDVLSSTVAEGPEATVCTTEGLPTLLWDSYDLHDQNLDAADGVADLPLSDWELTEQEGLRRVEQMLGRADRILEEEESVAAQEAVLDALVRSESRSDAGSEWSGDEAGAPMSSWDLAEAGVVGLEDSFDPAGSDGLGGVPGLSDPQPDLLRELQEVHLLDRLIQEENLKIQQLRCSDLALGDELPEGSGRSVGADREALRERLEEEKREVERLDKELGDRVPEEVRCLETDKRGGGHYPGAESCSRSEDRRSTLVLQDGQKPEEPEPPVVDQMSESDVDSPVGTRMSSFMEGHSEDRVLDGSQTSGETEPLGSGSASALDQPSSAQDPRGSKARGLESVPPQLCCVSGDELDPEPPLTPEVEPDEATSDPGVQALLPPLPKPRTVLLPGNEQLESTEGPDLGGGLGFSKPDPQAEEMDEPPETVAAGDGPGSVLHPTLNEQSNNNNNRQASGLVAADGGAASTEPSGLQDIQTPVRDSPEQPSAPRLPPDGRPEPVQDWLHGIHSSESARISGSAGVLNQPGSSGREMTDYQTPIVLDTGSGLMKAGFANQDLPHVVFPTIIGTPKYEEIMSGRLERETYIGHEAQHMRGVLALRHPIQNGIVRSWDDMEKIWHHTFQQLSVDPEDHPVLLTEAAMNPRENRQRMVELMFERFCVPFSYVAMQAVLALYADGRTTGVVLDSGDGVSHSVPVFDGYGLPHAVQRFPLAGADVTAHLRKLLQEQGVSMRTTAEEEIVREMKEKCCYVAADYEAELRRGVAPGGKACYTMPDGQVVTLGTERFRAPEILFKPELIGRDLYGIHESVLKSILSSDIDLRRSFLGNIVLSGGNTLLPGLPGRLRAEVAALVPADLREAVRVSSPSDRDFSVWSGGAVLAGLPSFSSAWISQQEYEECGPQVVFRKCL